MSFPSFASGEVLTAADMNAVGLWLVKTQTIGTAVSSVEVTNAFSSTYDNYLITISGGSASSAGIVGLRLGATATNYYSNLIYTSWSSTALATGSISATSWRYAFYGGTGIAGEVFVGNPNLAKPSWMRGSWFSLADTGFVTGYLNNTTQYTAFTVIPEVGTLTGGTIRVYGYRN